MIKFIKLRNYYKPKRVYSSNFLSLDFCLIALRIFYRNNDHIGIKFCWKKVTLPILVKDDNCAKIQMILYHTIIVYGVRT